MDVDPRSAARGCCSRGASLVGWLRALVALAALAPAVGLAIGLVGDGAQLWRASDLWSGGSPPLPAAFGWAVAAGDFDGDGLRDLAIGDPTADVGLAEEAGVVSVLYGAVGGLAGPEHQLWHQDVGSVPDVAESFDWFGYALAVGDFDDDGYDDLAIGTPLENDGALANSGSVQVLYGSPVGLVDAGAQDWHQDVVDVPDSNESDDLFGWSIASGDFDGDGYDDLAIGVVSENLSSTDQGQVLVLEGSSTGLFASAGSSRTFAQGVDGMLGSAESSDFFGEVLASGDYDDDGFDDLAVGVPSENVFLGSGANEGVVAVISGSATGLTTIGNVLLDQGDVSGQSRETEDRFGAALASGDFDGDGRDELAIGVPGENQGEGRVHVFRRFTGGWGVQGSPWGQAVPGMPGIAEQGDLFGDALAAGDFDGDGFVDLAVGAPGDRSSGMTSGALHVLYGTTSAGLSLADTQYWSQGDLAIAGTGPSSGERFAAALAAGDFDGDGADDLAAGVPDDFDAGSPVGGVNVIYSIGLCPNGVVDPGEECDDDNLTSEDGCSAVCVAEFCGDGVIQPGLGETCDDGNAISEDGCSDVCIPESCGDGVVQAGLGESCDDGGSTPGDGCSAACWPELGSADLFGTSMGGGISIEVAGVLVSIQTLPGQSAAEILAALQAAILADPTLASLGIQAAVVGERLYVSGVAAGYTISDLGLAATPSGAVTLAHTDAAAFAAALSGPASSEDFDALADGDPVGLLGGLTFVTLAPVEPLRASEAFDTTSAPVSLGIDHPDAALLDGDPLTLQLAQPADAVGVRIVTSDPALLDEIVLVTPVGAASNSDVVESSLPDGGHVYFVGLTSDTEFSEVVLGFDDHGETHFVYTLDDVTVRFVPEPGVLPSLAAGIALLAGAARRRRAAVPAPGAPASILPGPGTTQPETQP